IARLAVAVALVGAAKRGIRREIGFVAYETIRLRFAARREDGPVRTDAQRFARGCKLFARERPADAAAHVAYERSVEVRLSAIRLRKQMQRAELLEQHVVAARFGRAEVERRQALDQIREAACFRVDEALR